MRHYFLLIYTLASAVIALAQKPIEVAVFCLNDFHSSFVRNDFRGVPGAASVVQTLDSLRAAHPLSIVVSAGDNFGGSYFYRATRQNTPLPQFFSDCGINISGVGNHEFDEGQKALLHCWRDVAHTFPRPDWTLQYISANVRCDADNPMRRNGTSQPQFCNPHATESVLLPDGRSFKVNFVGLTTSSTPRQTSAIRVRGLSFDNRIQQVLDSLPASMWTNSHANILITHQGTNMHDTLRGDIRYYEPTWDDGDSLVMSKLDDSRICGIFSSHSHKPVAGYINNHRYPITQGGSQGKFIAMLKLEVDSATLEVLNVYPDLIPVTPKTQLNPKAARLNARIETLLETTRTKGGATLGELLTTASDNIPFDRSKMRHDQTYIGQLVTHAYSEALRQTEGYDDESIIVGVTHIGGIRGGLQKGPVRVMDVGEVLPFDNQMRVFRVTGKHLRTLIDAGLHNERYGYLQFAHLTPEMDSKGHVKSLTYITPKGKRIVIKKRSVCYIVADEFISNGGDGYNPALFPASKELHNVELPRITDAFINYLRMQPSI